MDASAWGLTLGNICLQGGKEMTVEQIRITKHGLLLILFLAGLFLALPAAASVCDEWNVLQREVRDGTIGRDEAVKKIVEMDGRLREAFSGNIVREPFRFPVKGYGPEIIGGSGGSGFRPEGYDFYDGNRHGGHPAHDLFIPDAEGKGLDSSTGKPAEIVSFTGGVVIAVNPSWEYPSTVRGGIYIWVYNPADDHYYYYAHLAKALVAPGDVVKAGDTIALLGRTGKNAWPKRSATHIHFMCLSFDGGRMTPVNTYRELLTSNPETLDK